MTKERSQQKSSLHQCCGSAKEEMARWKAIPKLELHAHLNGCVRSSTLLELASEQGRMDIMLNDNIEHIICQANRSLSDCFRLFPLIHALTTDHAIVTRITKEAIEDFAADNVVYLELRTTPKCNEAYGMTKRSYVEAVLAGFEAAGLSSCFKIEENDVCHENGGQELPHHRERARSEVQDKSQVYARLILSIDRRENAAAAMDTVLLAWEMRTRGVVGIDLSGDPTIGQWQTFLPALNWAKQHGLPLTLHCGEVFNPVEVQAMLALRPERLGHVCYLDKPEWRSLLESSIPVEVCLTSNFHTQGLSSIFDHHFAALHKANHPTIFCTDDPGVFSTCLSHEYSLAANVFGVSDMELLIMGKNAVNYTFAEDQLKLILREIFEKALITLSTQQKHQGFGCDLMEVGSQS